MQPPLIQNGNRGTVNFDTVTFDNGVSVDAVANFRLTDSTGLPTTPDPSSALLYELELTTSGVTGVAANEGSLQSFVGFDFNDSPNNSDRLQPSETISGFGTSQVSIGDVNTPVERVLSGDFVFNIDDPVLGNVIANETLDGFNGTIASNIDSDQTRFNDTPSSFVSANGNLGFSGFRDFGDFDFDSEFQSAGAIGFRSVAGVTAGIPEPSTLLMASMGLGMVAFRRRRKQA